MVAPVFAPVPAFGGVVSCGGETATIVGTDGPDVLVGTSGPDVIAGLGGNDVIRGLLGDDRLCGNGGHDLIVGGGGSDWISGGSGRDDLRGSRSGDTIFGGAGRDAIDGGQGADILFGGTHRDVIRGGDRNDRINGGEGSDTLLGGAGNDDLWGGIGVDFCRGEGRRACESFSSDLRIKVDGLGGSLFGAPGTDDVLSRLRAIFGDAASDSGWLPNGGGLGVCPGGGDTTDIREVSFSANGNSLSVKFYRPEGEDGVLFQSHSRGLVTDRGVRGGETLAQVRVAYNDVWMFPEPDVAEAVAADAGFFFVHFGPPGPFGSFRTSSLGDWHFDTISGVEAGQRCHS